MKTRRNNNAEFLCLHLHGIRCVGFCKDDYGDKKETHPPQKSPQTIIHKIKGGNYYEKGLCYNHGNEILLRFQSVQHRQKLTCKKEHNNPYDSEAIKVTMKNIGTVGYIANSPYTKANGTMGAGAVNKYVKKKFKIRVMFMTSTKIICEVIDGFKDKYSEEKTEPTDKIEEKEVVEF